MVNDDSWLALGQEVALYKTQLSAQEFGQGWHGIKGF